MRANDSTAELATGGLIFVQNNHVEMRSEDLFVSAAEIRVRYTFFNKTDRNVTVLVAFPMPEVRIEHQDQSFSLPTDDPVNMLEFATSVGGKPVETKVEQRVFAAGIDRTQMLRDLGIPLAPHLPSHQRGARPPVARQMGRIDPRRPRRDRGIRRRQGHAAASVGALGAADDVLSGSRLFPPAPRP